MEPEASLWKKFLAIQCVKLKAKFLIFTDVWLKMELSSTIINTPYVVFLDGNFVKQSYQKFCVCNSTENLSVYKIVCFMQPNYQ